MQYFERTHARINTREMIMVGKELIGRSSTFQLTSPQYGRRKQNCSAASSIIADPGRLITRQFMKLMNRPSRRSHERPTTAKPRPIIRAIKPIYLFSGRVMLESLDELLPSACKIANPRD